MAIVEDFHSQVGGDKVKTTLYKIRWEGYEKKDDTWESITYLQGYATMVKSFKESHAKDLEKLAADQGCVSSFFLGFFPLGFPLKKRIIFFLFFLFFVTISFFQ